MDKNKRRPVYLNLVAIRLPVGAVVSILHRVSGVLLVVGIPLAVYLLQLSLRDIDGFERARAAVSPVWARGLLLLAIWALAHHAFAGLRHLLMDLDIGLGRRIARASAALVLLASVGLTAFAASGLFP